MTEINERSNAELQKRLSKIRQLRASLMMATDTKARGYQSVLQIISKLEGEMVGIQLGMRIILEAQKLSAEQSADSSEDAIAS